MLQISTHPVWARSNVYRPWDLFRETTVYPHTTQYEHHYIPTVLWEREIVCSFKVWCTISSQKITLSDTDSNYFFCRWNFYSSNAGIVSFDKYCSHSPEHIAHNCLQICDALFSTHTFLFYFCCTQLNCQGEITNDQKQGCNNYKLC